MRLPLLLASLLLLPAFAGCLAGDEPAPADDAGAPAATAQDAGAVAGPAPSGAKDAYVVPASETEDAKEAVAHPVPVRTNEARPPVVLDLSDEFTSTDCRGLRFGMAEQTLQQASRPRRFHDLSDQLQVGDVFQYNVTLSFENADGRWAEIQAMYGFGSTIRAYEEGTADKRGLVTIAWEGQGYRTSDSDPSFIDVNCWFGQLQEPLPYTLTVSLTFADNAIPAEAPMRLPVPEGAARLFVRGVPLDGEKGVLSHFRLFGPDDRLVCECALNSDRQVATVELPGPGDYVLLVDHTANGFVSAALDAPAQEEMTAMEMEWRHLPLFTVDGEASAFRTFEFDVPTVPLLMHAYVVSPESGNGGAGRHTKLSVTNERGEVLRVGWGGHLTFDDPQGQGRAWLGMSPDGWEFFVDHHAYSPGKHVATLESEALRGQVVLVTRQYVR